MAARKRKKCNISLSGLYTMEVSIIEGPVEEKFLEQNPIISRTIEIQGDQTLEDLHHEIFSAFDREDEHMYEFQIGGKGPNDPNAKQYGLSGKCDGETSKTTIHSLKLKKDDIFGYWFDFGDYWWHQINVISTKNEIPTGKYPKVVKKVGVSPPQYPDYEDE